MVISLFGVYRRKPSENRGSGNIETFLYNLDACVFGYTFHDLRGIWGSKLRIFAKQYRNDGTLMLCGCGYL